MEIRICNKCNQSKNLIENYNFIKSEKRYNRICKECINKYNKIHYSKLEEQIRSKEYHKLNYLKNKEKLLYQQKEYYINNKDNLYLNIKKWKTHKFKNDPFYKIPDNLRSRICNLLKNNKSKSTIHLIGCTIQELKQYLESMFLSEMSWENYGKVWEIDHIKPCSSFNLIDEEQQKLCFHYTNMRPLFKTTEIAKQFGYINYMGNRNKGNKLI